MESQSPSKDEEAEALVVDPNNQHNSQLFLSPATYLRVKDNFTPNFPTDEPNYHKSFVQLETLHEENDLLMWRIRKGWEVGAVVARVRDVCSTSRNDDPATFWRKIILIVLLVLFMITFYDPGVGYYALSFGSVPLVILCLDWINYGCDQEIRAEQRHDDDTDVVTLTIRYLAKPEFLKKWFSGQLRDQTIEIQRISNERTIDVSNTSSTSSSIAPWTHRIFVKEYEQHQRTTHLKDTMFRVVALDAARGTEFIILDGLGRSQEAFYIQQKLSSFLLANEQPQRNHVALSSSSSGIATTTTIGQAELQLSKSGQCEELVKDVVEDSVVVTTMERHQHPDYVVEETFVFPDDYIDNDEAAAKSTAALPQLV